MLLGWLDETIGEEAAPAVLASMTRANESLQGAASLSQTGLSFGLAVQGHSRECALKEDDDISAAIFGQPFWTHDDLTSLAKRDGHAAALAEAYRRYGDALFRYLRGTFALAVIVRPAGRVLLAIDRYGVERLCYTRTSTGLVFASSSDSVAAHPVVTSTISEQAVFNFLYFGISPSPGTIHREQSKLLPAQCLVLDGNTVRTSFYWQMPYGEEIDAPVERLSSELMDRLRTAVRRTTEGEDSDAMGAFLSGGLDSSTVAGLLSEEIGEPAGKQRIKTFTIGFSNARYDETHYADISAKHFHTEQHSYYLTPPDVVDLLTRLSRASDEPFGNSSVVPTYYCAKMAREHGVTKILAGDGGDEIFAGNSRYVEQQILGLYSRIPSFMRQGMIEPIVFGLPGFDRMRFGRAARNYINRARLPMPDRMESFNFYRNAALPDVFTDAMLAHIDPEEPLANLRESYDRTQSQSMLQRMLHLDLKITLADNDLRKVNTACAMAGVRVAYPFLDDDLVEFSAKLPPKLLIRQLRRRWLFKQSVAKFLAPETLAKRKHGFGMPFTEWPREHDGLREMAQDCLQGFTSRGYLRRSFLDQVIGSRDGGFDGLVWDIVILELWLRERANLSAKRAAA